MPTATSQITRSPVAAPHGSRPRTRLRTLSGDRIVIDAWQRSDGARVHQTLIRGSAEPSRAVQLSRNVTSSDGRILETIIATLAGAKRGEGISSRSWFEGDDDRIGLSVYESYGPGRVLTNRRVVLADDHTRASIRIDHAIGGEIVVAIVAGRATAPELDALLARAHLLVRTALR
jgi:hypothetical protein